MDCDRRIKSNLNDLLDSNILILKHRLKAHHLRPKIEVVKEYGNIPRVECYAGQLNQVFINILSNAIDALEESNIVRSYNEIVANPNCITITTKLSDNSQQVIIIIKDNGIGILEEVKTRIFDRLYTTKAIDKGTGLGLSIARQIVVSKHGGYIEVNSTPGQGTEFAIAIPVTV